MMETLRHSYRKASYVTELRDLFHSVLAEGDRCIGYLARSSVEVLARDYGRRSPR